VTLGFLRHAGAICQGTTDTGASESPIGRANLHVGTLEDGTPWFVMEYLTLPLTDYCRQPSVGETASAAFRLVARRCSTRTVTPSFIAT